MFLTILLLDILLIFGSFFMVTLEDIKIKNISRIMNLKFNHFNHIIFWIAIHIFSLWSFIKLLGV